MARRRQPKIPVDPVIRGCLDRIRTCEMTAVGVLADYLDETVPNAESARKLRAAYTRCERNCRIIGGKDVSRRRRSKWELIASWRRYLWFRVREIFNRKWTKHPTLRDFWSPPTVTEQSNP